MWGQRDCPGGHGHRQLLLSGPVGGTHVDLNLFRFQSSAGKVNVLSTDRVENVLSLLSMLIHGFPINSNVFISQIIRKSPIWF